MAQKKIIPISHENIKKLISAILSITLCTFKCFDIFFMLATRVNGKKQKCNIKGKILYFVWRTARDEIKIKNLNYFNIVRKKSVALKMNAWEILIIKFTKSFWSLWLEAFLSNLLIQYAIRLIPKYWKNKKKPWANLFSGVKYFFFAVHHRYFMVKENKMKKKTNSIDKHRAAAKELRRMWNNGWIFPIVIHLSNYCFDSFTEITLILSLLSVEQQYQWHHTCVISELKKKNCDFRQRAKLVWVDIILDYERERKFCPLLFAVGPNFIREMGKSN